MLLHSDNLSYGGLEYSYVPTISLLADSFLQMHWAGVVGLHPLRSPPNARPRRATGRVGAKPNTSMLSAVPAKPEMRMGFLPILSLSLPQITPVENSANAKAEVTVPA